MSYYNEALKLDNNALVFIDKRTRGHKALETKLTKLGVKWSNDIIKGVTHAVCTRFATRKCKTVSDYGNKLTYKYRESNHSDSWMLLNGMTIYRCDEFVRLLDNDVRQEVVDENDNVLKLLMSKNESSFLLGVAMIKDHKMDPRWIPWLKSRTKYRKVTKLLRELNIDYRTGNYMDQPLYQTSQLKELFSRWGVTEDYAPEFVKQLLNMY